MRRLQARELGRIGYAEALAVQNALVAQRKQGAVPDPDEDEAQALLRD